MCSNIYEGLTDVEVWEFKKKKSEDKNHLFFNLQNSFTIH